VRLGVRSEDRKCSADAINCRARANQRPEADQCCMPVRRPNQSIGAEADLGFCKGECQIHLKGAPEVKNRRRRGSGVREGGCAPSAENFCISYIKMVSFSGDIY